MSSRYVRKCPHCGSRDLWDECTWDTVTGQGCNECGWSQDIGYVGGAPGEHYLVEYDHMEDAWNQDDYEDEYDDDELVQLDQLDPNSEDWDELELLDDSDPLPF